MPLRQRNGWLARSRKGEKGLERLNGDSDTQVVSLLLTSEAFRIRFVSLTCSSLMDEIKLDV